MERVWGGRRLETHFSRRLPPSVRIGESWEIVDREEYQSVVHDGPLRGFTLNELWTTKREEIFGPGLPDTPRFPLLFKILDAQERLSVQVHPPAEMAAQKGGEPKTEMWHVLDALLDSDLYAGLKRGVTRPEFERAIHEGHVADKIHSFRIKAGDTMFIPSGRIHAIGAGNLLVEVQQNSDTTYRVFDWNRLGTNGKLRELHVKESLEAINFDDIEPQIAEPKGEVISDCEHFRVEKWALTEPRSVAGNRFAIFTVTNGSVNCGGRTFHKGDFFLVPAAAEGLTVDPAEGEAAVLMTTIPR